MMSFEHSGINKINKNIIENGIIIFIQIFVRAKDSKSFSATTIALS
jgi:hypothetical protein